MSVFSLQQLPHPSHTSAMHELNKRHDEASVCAWDPLQLSTSDTQGPQASKTWYGDCSEPHPSYTLICTMQSVTSQSHNVQGSCSHSSHAIHCKPCKHAPTMEIGNIPKSQVTVLCLSILHRGTCDRIGGWECLMALSGYPTACQSSLSNSQLLGWRISFG